MKSIVKADVKYPEHKATTEDCVVPQKNGRRANYLRRRTRGL